MPASRTAGWVLTGVATGIVTLVAASVVFVGASAHQLLLAAAAGWLPLQATFVAVDADRRRLSRFVVVFCGSLVGLSLLSSAVVGHSTLRATLSRLASLEFVVAVNPVMTVLVGGALAVSYYAVFEWSDHDLNADSDGTAV